MSEERKPIRIETPFGPVTEYARKQAAENIRNDADLRAKVMDLLVKETGSVELAEAEFRRRYPEASEVLSQDTTMPTDKT